jgi:predicted hydrocarbon binding protein
LKPNGSASEEKGKGAGEENGTKEASGNCVNSNNENNGGEARAELFTPPSSSLLPRPSILSSQCLSEGKPVLNEKSFADLKKSVETLFGPGAHTLMYYVGKGSGKKCEKRLSQIYGSRSALLDACLGVREKEGWGLFRCEIGEDGTGVVRVEDCFEAKGYGPSSEPVCHFVRGYIEGFLSRAFQRELKVTEEECLARGSGCCVF